MYNNHNHHCQATWYAVQKLIIQYSSTVYVTGFQKINHFVTIRTLNIYSWNKILHSTNQQYIELSVSLYRELPETLWNILIASSVLI